MFVKLWRKFASKYSLLHQYTRVVQGASFSKNLFICCFFLTDTRIISEQIEAEVAKQSACSLLSQWNVRCIKSAPKNLTLHAGKHLATYCTFLHTEFINTVFGLRCAKYRFSRTSVDWLRSDAWSWLQDLKKRKQDLKLTLQTSWKKILNLRFKPPDVCNGLLMYLLRPFQQWSTLPGEGNRAFTSGILVLLALPASETFIYVSIY